MPSIDAGPSNLPLLPSQPFMSDLSLSDKKRLLRLRMKEIRHGDHSKFPDAFKALANNFERHVKFEDGLYVASYAAMDDEMNPGLLTERLRAKGHKIALPRVVAKGQPLSFHLHKPGDILCRSAFGALEPAADSPLAEPDVLLVPLLAFDRSRYRLGYGGGFYDRTLAYLRRRKRILAIGIGYGFQQVESIPHNDQDEKLDLIVTDKGIL